MPVAEFPMESVSASNPHLCVFQELTEKFNVGFSEYDDLARDTALQTGGVGVKRWLLFYDGLTYAMAAILDSHAFSARLAEDGELSAYTFNFRDRDSGLLYSGVRYQSYQKPQHKDKEAQQRSMVLVRFP